MILDDQGRPMVVVLECQGENEARVALSFLEARGISARLNSDVPHSILPLTVSKLGKVQVLVSADLAEEAKALLDDPVTGTEEPEHSGR